MNRAQQLSAILKRTPDSIAPDGAPLRFISVHQVKRLYAVRERQISNARKQREG